jgi:hypothetical protein
VPAFGSESEGSPCSLRVPNSAIQGTFDDNWEHQSPSKHGENHLPWRDYGTEGREFESLRARRESPAWLGLPIVGAAGPRWDVPNVSQRGALLPAFSGRLIEQITGAGGRGLAGRPRSRPQRQGALERDSQPAAGAAARHLRARDRLGDRPSTRPRVCWGGVIDVLSSRTG